MTTTSSWSRPARNTPRCRWRSTKCWPARSAPANGNPSLRIWEWASNAVIIGSFQSLRNEVDLEAAARHDVTVVRRISGGGAMFVEPGNTITYSLYVPGSLVEGLSFAASYAFLDDWVLGALADVGINARYVPLNDIASPAGKIAGAAQKRLVGGAVLHHVTMAYDIDADKMLDVLRIGREKMSDKGIKSANKRVDPLRSQTGLSREAIVDAMIAHFDGRYGLTPVELDAATIAEATALAAEQVLHAGVDRPSPLDGLSVPTDPPTTSSQAGGSITYHERQRRPGIDRNRRNGLARTILRQVGAGDAGSVHPGRRGRP